MSDHQATRVTHTAVLPPAWSLHSQKSWLQSVYDFCLAPFRMVLLPDTTCESLHLTSLRAERFAAVLPHLRGRVLDIGAGDNVLVRLYKDAALGKSSFGENVDQSVGVDVISWGGGVVLIESADKLPFPDASFDTVSYIACINHIPERIAALAEAFRVLKPGGQVVMTMIGRHIGEIGHKLWWYSEDKHREVDHDELMGMDKGEVVDLLNNAGFTDVKTSGFVYGLNTLYLACKPVSGR